MLQYPAGGELVNAKKSENEKFRIPKAFSETSGTSHTSDDTGRTRRGHDYQRDSWGKRTESAEVGLEKLRV